MAAKAKAKTGPSALRGSREAKKRLALVLEALSGVLSTTQAAEGLGVTASRYYQLELHALQGMMGALEPRERGPKRDGKREIQALKAEKKALEAELRRSQSLLRAATRSLGVKARPKRSDGGKQGRKRTRRKARGQAVLETLRKEEPGGTPEQGAAADRAAGGE